MHVCMYECIHECMYISVYVYMHVCMYQNQKIKSKIFYSHKTLTLINMNNISNTVICKNKARALPVHKRENTAKNGQPRFK